MNDPDFEPDWMSAPGATISSMLEDRSLSVKNFADVMGYTIERAGRLLAGRSAITKDVAERLAAKIGGSQKFWISREEQYRTDIARLQVAGRSVAGKEWLNELPIQDMQKFGWISSDGTLSGKLAACLKFFDVPNVAAWRAKYKDILSAVSFRTSTTFDSEPGSVMSWLRYANMKAASIDCKDWDNSRFGEMLGKIRDLTRIKDPNSFIRRMRGMCADCGVALVIARAPAGCRASGATQFIAPNKAMILLSFRYLSDDHFWFTFFHEAGHLMLHSQKALFLEDDSEVTSNEEDEANKFAEEILVPSHVRDELSAIPLNKFDIVKFGVKIGISRGVVVGQLQHIGRLHPDQLNWMKRRYRWERIDL